MRVTGKVLEIGSAAPATWRLSSGREKLVHHDPGSVIVEDEGRRITIECHAIEVMGDPRVERGGWRELVERGFPRFERGKAQSFDAAELAITELAVGDTIAAWGDGEGDRMIARAIARGAGAARRIDKLVPRPAGRSWAALWWGVPLAMVALAIAWPLSGGALGVSFALVAAAVIARPSAWDDGLVLRARERDIGEGVPMTPVRMMAGLGAIAAMIVTADASPRWADGFAAVIVVGGIVVTVIGWRTLRHAAALLGDPPWRGEPGGPFTIRGTIRCASPVKIGARDAALGVEAKVDEGHSVSTENRSYHFRENASFAVAREVVIASEGGEVTVAADELAWTSTCEEIADRVEGSTSSTYTFRRWVPVDALVLARGWIEGTPPRLVARGTEPAMLLASAPGGDPRTIPRAIVGYWRGTALGLAAVGLALAAFELSRW